MLLNYSAYLPGEFVAALREQFTERTSEEERPCTCFFWHRTSVTWQWRIQKLASLVPPGSVAAMTPFWDGVESSARPAKLAGNYPPLNRSIEFKEPEPDSMTHEMIHWCTSLEFDQRSHQLVGDDRVLVREGATEWLKRNATKDWNKGGYTDVLPGFKQVIDTGALSGERLMRAYFGGKDVDAVIRAIVDGFHRLQASAVRGVQSFQDKAALGDALNVVRKTMVGTRSPELRERVYVALASLDDAALRQEQPRLSWLKYLRARRAGDDDATAVTKA